MAKCEERNASGTINSQFFKRGQYSSSSKYYYTKDRNSSVREVSDSTGNTKSEYAYDGFGVLTKLSETVQSEFCYDMYYYHSTSGLNLTPYRAYAPVVGRWISRDPLQEDINPYQYVSNNPIGARDPLGLPVGSANGHRGSAPNPEGSGTNDGDGGGDGGGIDPVTVAFCTALCLTQPNFVQCFFACVFGHPDTPNLCAKK